MSRLLEVIKEALDKPTVTLKSDGRMRIKLDRKTADKNRGVERHRGQLKIGDHLRIGNGAFERALMITKIRKYDQPHPETGNTHEITAHPVGKIFSSSNPKYGHSTRRPDGGTYVPQERAVKSKVYSMQNHPKYGWIEGRAHTEWTKKNNWDPNERSGREGVTAVRPKEAKYTDFYK